MDFSYSGMMAGLLFGIWGVYFFRQGKKDSNLKLIAIGITLFIYPYFISDTALLWGVGVSLTALGFYI